MLPDGANDLTNTFLTLYILFSFHFRYVLILLCLVAVCQPEMKSLDRLIDRLTV